MKPAFHLVVLAASLSFGCSESSSSGDAPAPDAAAPDAAAPDTVPLSDSMPVEDGAPQAPDTPLASPDLGAPDGPAPVPDAAPFPEAPPSIAPGVYPFAGVAPDLPTDDLRRLDTLLEGVDVVGIGESIHTTAGQFRARNRILRDLIEHGGLRMLAFEASRTGIRDVLDPYLHSDCAGDVEAASMALHTIWWDVSTPEFFRWVCEYNLEHADAPVRASGFDIRQPWTDVPALRAYLETNSPDEGAGLADGLSTCLGVGHADERAFFTDPVVQGYYSESSPMPEGPHLACRRGGTAVEQHLEDRRDALVASTSETAYEEARIALVAAVAFDTTIYWLSRSDIRRANAARDDAMHDLFVTQRRLDFPAARVGIWAHNGHIMRAASDLVDNQWTGVQSLGTRLGDELGPAYAALGQAALETRYNWMQGLQTLPPPTDDSLEVRLAGLGQDALLVDPAETAADPASVLPDVPMDVGFDAAMHPLAHYDVILWHRVSEAAEFFANPRPE